MMTGMPTTTAQDEHNESNNIWENGTWNHTGRVLCSVTWSQVLEEWYVEYVRTD